jgi:catechol 2,3-dioxygenase-like lactoylglutathione lyase family enzyme
MEIIHYSLACSSTENADRFYTGCLGFEKTATKFLPADLSETFFNLNKELVVLNYTRNNIMFEIIINELMEPKLNPIEHICLSVENKPEFLKKIDGLGLNILQKKKGEKTVTFIYDFDGNLFEIVESSN